VDASVFALVVRTVGYNYVKIFGTPGCRNPSGDYSQQYQEFPFDRRDGPPGVLGHDRKPRTADQFGGVVPQYVARGVVDPDDGERLVVFDGAQRRLIDEPREASWLSVSARRDR
jgi:hypothetical protein